MVCIVVAESLLGECGIDEALEGGGSQGWARCKFLCGYVGGSTGFVFAGFVIDDGKRAAG